MLWDDLDWAQARRLEAMLDDLEACSCFHRCAQCGGAGVDRYAFGTRKCCRCGRAREILKDMRSALRGIQKSAL